MKTRVSKWLDLAVILLFCAATFQIADGHWIPGAACFGGAALILCITKGHIERKDGQRKKQ